MKMTKREMNTRMAGLMHKYEMLLEKEENMRKEQDRGKIYTQEEWQDVSTELFKTDAAIDDLTREWERRNWTASDYAMAEMIAENRD